MSPRALTYLLLLSGLSTAGCSITQSRPRADFHATDTPSRVPAIVDAAERDDTQTLAELVHALMDEDPAVRLFAIQSLFQRTGEDFGYRYYGPVDQRRAAVTRWHDYLAGQGIVPIQGEPADQDPPDPQTPADDEPDTAGDPTDAN